MGRDKALLPYRGGNLAGAVARAVESAAGRVTLVGNPGIGGIADLYPGEGPLGGILTALHHTAAEWNLVVACDMPGVSGELLSRLLDAAEASGADSLLPSGPSGRLEPLCAVYRRQSLERLEASFARGVRKVTAALEGLAIVRLAVPELAPFQNVNTPEDWERYAAE
jgi:molybdenum cofactor guanylyltransferase